MSEQTEDRRDQREAQGEGPDRLPLVLAAILFLPAMVTAGAYYSLLRFGRLRLSVIASVAAVVDLLLLAYLLLSSALPSFLPTLLAVGSLGQHWPTLLKVLIPLNLILGSFVGLAFVSWEVRNMDRNPHLTRVPGFWTYKFTFRRTPREELQKRRIIKNLRLGVYECEERSPLGLSETRRYRPVFRYATEARTHTLSIGASGSGKTITLMNLIHNDIVSETPVVVLDLKRDPEFASKLATWAEECGADFYHFVNGDPADYDITGSIGQAYYDALAAGSPGSKADMMLNMREYDSNAAVFKTNMTQLLQVTFQMLKQADRGSIHLREVPIEWEAGGLRLLASAVKNMGRITGLAAACEGTEVAMAADELVEALTGKTTLSQQLTELQGQLRTITASEYGRWLDAGRGKRNIDLFRLTQKPGTVVLFSLNSDAEPDFVKYIGSLIMADLTNVSARRRNKALNNPVNIYIDEFQALNPSSVASLLEKSRASAMAVTLAQQSLEQIIASSQFNGEAYLNSIIDTCSNFLVHSGSTQGSAERLSKIIGEESVEKYRVSNANSNRLFKSNWRNKQNQMVSKETAKDWKFPPERFMSLSAPSPHNNYRTTAVYITKTCADPAFEEDNKLGALAREVLLIPHQEVLTTYYEVDHSRDSAEEERQGPADFTSFEEDFEAEPQEASSGGATAVSSISPLKEPASQEEWDDDEGVLIEDLEEVEDEEIAFTTALSPRPALPATTEEEPPSRFVSLIQGATKTDPSAPPLQEEEKAPRRSGLPEVTPPPTVSGKPPLPLTPTPKKSSRPGGLPDFNLPS